MARIAHFIDTFTLGGAETMICRLSEALKSRGHNPIILHFGHRYFQEACEQMDIDQFILPGLKQYKSMRTLPVFSMKFFRLLKRLKIELLHSHLFGPITGSYMSASMNGIPHIGTLHDVMESQQSTSRRLLLYGAHKGGTSLVAVSQDMKSFYQDFIPGSPNIKCIYNGLPANQFRQKYPDPLSSYAESAETRIVTVASLIPLKRHIFQIEALADLLRNNTVRMFFVGIGPEYPQIQSKIEELGLQDRIFLLGQRMDIPAILNNCDIFVLSSETEGLSCSILEAMAAGLPCVVSKVGGNPELVAHQESGFVFNPTDQKAMRDYVGQLITSQTLRLQQGVAAKKRVDSDFSIENMADQYDQLYQYRLKPNRHFQHEQA